MDEPDANSVRRHLIQMIADSQEVMEKAIDSSLVIATPLTIPELVLVTTYLIDGAVDETETPNTRAALFLTGKRLMGSLQAALEIVRAGPPNDPHHN